MARGVFASRIETAEAFAELLAGDGVLRGLIGPRETPRLWDRHILNSAVLANVVADGARVADIGSGAGLPGVVLAIARPDVQVTLIEPLLRRTTFLTEAADTLGLSNVRVVRARAEDLHGEESFRPGFDVVTSRAVAPLDRLLTWSLPLVAPAGEFLALKGDRASAEVGSSTELHRWSVTTPEIVELGAAVLETPTYAVRLRWSQPESVAWPPVRTVAPSPRGRARRRR
ncbi:16S rRNA (guanine(527)-N(7))-methyltransferase RsmG [Nocardioides sp. C4-1]|uniref:16S rRNA (guanine(527)-N(7))-methyltransferase RsmG n=1 Tax=Nocardioides sp. C4-1 TaxID=3151851 RepID=UPI003267D68E